MCDEAPREWVPFNSVLSLAYCQRLTRCRCHLAVFSKGCVTLIADLLSAESCCYIRRCRYVIILSLLTCVLLIDLLRIVCIVFLPRPHYINQISLFPLRHWMYKEIRGSVSVRRIESKKSPIYRPYLFAGRVANAVLWRGQKTMKTHQNHIKILTILALINHAIIYRQCNQWFAITCACVWWKPYAA